MKKLLALLLAVAMVLSGRLHKDADNRADRQAYCW